MRKVIFLAVVGGLAWWLLGRRGEATRPGATIGYADGSAVTLEPGSPELERLLEIAAGATGA